MKQKTLGLNVLIFLFLGLSNLMSAQSGLIGGKVLEVDAGTTLPGANVYLKTDPSIGTVTDIDGNFTIAGVPVGSQIIMISFTGYQTQEIPVEVTQGKLSRIEVMMEFVSFSGVEVVVTAQILGQAKAINQQLNSESIANIVAADRIQELPDVNAAEAIARLPGVSLNRSGGEGQKVVIRGMEPKFNAITVNGVRLPSNSGTDRSVDLSLISPELLDGIEVYKSPLPDMDAESIGGTVNLKLRKAPKDFKLLTRAFKGYNQLNDDTGDYKALVQASKRFFKDKFGVVAQGNIERFNRGGDYLTYFWSQGRTDPETGVTAIEGDRLRFEDRQEIRRRWNGSLNLDYDLGKSNIALFGLYSKTERDQFRMQNIYDPGEPNINYIGRDIDNQLDLYSIALSGDHKFEKVSIDWNIARSQTDGSTPYDFNMNFFDDQVPFDSDLNRTGHPRTFLNASNPDLQSAYLRGNELRSTNTLEETQTYFVNLKVPLKLADKIAGYFKFGGKYFTTERERNVSIQAEDFYYLGGEITQLAREANGDPLIPSSVNSSLISIRNFLSASNLVEFNNEDGTMVNFDATLDPDLMNNWYNAQRSLLNNDRSAIVENYGVSESVTAGYAMLKLNFGEKLSVIPGFRYEYSDNEYRSAISSINGRYGVNGFLMDTVTTQQYGEFLPHLHIKYEPLNWLDIRASFATTLARPDFSFITPRAQINNTSTVITAGNPDLRHARAQNFDLFVSAYKGGLGLLSFGVFYKDIDNIFIPRTIQLASPELAVENGWPNNSGYQLNSYTNLAESKVYGFEVDLQTNLSFLPSPFNGIVFNVNYARLYSETQVYFLTSESVLIIPFPPVFETTYTSNIRDVSMPSQSPHIFNMSIGYDYKGFSARFSGAYQGTKARSYSLNKDFDRFDLEFWRWDASVKQKVGDHWSFFLNFNNINNQQDVSFTRNENYLNTIQTFGWTGTAGLQFKL